MFLNLQHNQINTIKLNNSLVKKQEDKYNLPV